MSICAQHKYIASLIIMVSKIYRIWKKWGFGRLIMDGGAIIEQRGQFMDMIKIFKTMYISTINCCLLQLHQSDANVLNNLLVKKYILF